MMVQFSYKPRTYQSGLFGLGTFFSLLVVYFFYLYSQTQLGKTVDWGLLNSISKWYLIIVLGIFGLTVLFFLFSVLSFLGTWLFLRSKR